MPGMRVLLVDDEPELVFTMAERLELRGYEVDAVTSGAEALERVRNTPYDVAVVDLKMPGMSGAEVLDSISADYPEMPVILLTGHGASGEEEQDSVEVKACAYLFKPINIEELIKAMEACLKDKHERRSPSRAIGSPRAQADVLRRDHREPLSRAEERPGHDQRVLRPTG
jgi:DNA-binding response OmpR family regulator